MITRFRFVSALSIAALLWASSAPGWSFGVCGDSRDDGNGIFPQILSSVQDSDMEFLLHTGDIERTGGPRLWETFKAKTSGFAKPMHLLIGNHEIYGSTGEEFARFFGLPGSSYSFTHRDTRFVLLDNAGGSLPDSRLEWLDGELTAHPRGKSGIAHLVLAMHIPPRTDGIFPHGTKNGYAAQSLKLLEVLLRHKVDLVLCGHEHMQLVEDWSGIKVVVSGGAGAPMVPLQEYGFFRVDVTGRGIREKFIRVKPVPSPAR